MGFIDNDQRINRSLETLLRVNMDYQQGEKVVVLRQLAMLDSQTPERYRPSLKLSKRMSDLYGRLGIDVSVLEYNAVYERHNAPVPEELLEKALSLGASKVIAPTTFSVTHTDFTNRLDEEGVWVGTLPEGHLGMFDLGGILDITQAQYKEIIGLTKQYADHFREGGLYRITGLGTNLVVNLGDSPVVHESTGIMSNKRRHGNLNPAEAYAIPVLDGTNGHLTVPRGYGGKEAFQIPVSFYFRDGAIVRIIPSNSRRDEDRKYVKEQVKPYFMTGNNRNLVAELGRGTNVSFTSEKILDRGLEGWTINEGEKIYETAHIGLGTNITMGGTIVSDQHIDLVFPVLSITRLD